MEKLSKFLLKTKKLITILWKKDPNYQVTRSFAFLMLPLTFVAGLFICFVLPVSYYYFSKQEKLNQAEFHAKYLASIFREVIETYPLNWEDVIKQKLKIINADCVVFYDSKNRIIATLGKRPETFIDKITTVKVKCPVHFNNELYGFVEVSLSILHVWLNIVKILIISILIGTIEGLALWLIPVFYIWQDEKNINQSRRELLQERERLKASEDRYRVLFEFAPDGFVVSTLEGEIVHFNKRFANMIRFEGESPTRLNAKKFYVDPLERDRLIDELVKNGEIRNKEVLLRRIDGEEFTALLSMRLIGASVFKEEVSISNTTHTLIFAAIRDISKLKEMEKQLLQAQKLESVGLLAGGIAHDFNNILAVISGYNELLRHSLKDSNSINYTKVIEKSIKRAEELVNNLLAFARAGKYKTERINLNDILKDLESLLVHTFDKRIVFRFELSSDLSFIFADSSQITQVIMNLCINARDALLSKGGGRILIKTYSQFIQKDIFTITGDRIPPGQYVILEIEDNGPGIPPEIIGKIFEPFFTTKPVGEGTGLGLSVVYGIVRNHGGYIDVRSKPGETKFLVYFPKAQAIDQPKKILVGKSIPIDLRGQGTILVVDDEKEIRQFIRSVLEEHGYRVIEAQNGYEAIEIFQEKAHEIDLVLLDLIMPEMDGKDTFWNLKKLLPNIRVILLTGYVADSTVRSMLNNGARAFLTKPFRLQDLLVVVNQVLTETKYSGAS